MSNTNQPRGLYPVGHLGGGTIRTRDYTINAAYGTNIYRGDAVKLASDGTIQQAAAGDVILGVFDGCFFIDPTQPSLPPQFSPYWPSNANATAIVAAVYDDPNIVFACQASGSLALTNVGNNADIVVNAGSTVTGQSGNTLNSATADTSARNLRILGLVNAPDNAWGSYAKVEVIINNHFYKTTTGV